MPGIFPENAFSCTKLCVIFCTQNPTHITSCVDFQCYYFSVSLSSHVQQDKGNTGDVTTSRSRCPLLSLCLSFPMLYRGDRSSCHPPVPLGVPLGGTVGKDFFACCLPASTQKWNFGEGVTWIWAWHILIFLPFVLFPLHSHTGTPRLPPPVSVTRIAHQTRSLERPGCCLGITFS